VLPPGRSCRIPGRNVTALRSQALPFLRWKRCETIVARVGLMLVCALLVVFEPSSAKSPLGLHLTPCTQGRSRLAAERGTFGVYENRLARTGRIIALRVVVLQARHRSGRAVAWIPGGPGQGAVSLASTIADGRFAKELTALRDRFYVLFVDSRGMGESQPFKCDFTPARHPAVYFRQLFPDALVSACRQKTATRSDRNAYNTNNAVDDLDAVRNELGYSKIVLDGGSYGTFFHLCTCGDIPSASKAQCSREFLRRTLCRCPALPTARKPRSTTYFANAATMRVCHTHFPAFERHFDRLMQRFDRDPVSVRVKNTVTKRFETVALSKEVLVDRLRQALYDPENAAAIPYVVERAFHADYVPLADLVYGMSEALASALDMGAFLSYTCADELPFMPASEARAMAAHSFAKDLRFRAQRRACAIWHVRPMPAAFNDPVHSRVPILMISGSDDPATPPRYGAEALRYLPNGRQAVVRGAGHTAELPCTDTLLVRFARAASARALDVSRCHAAFVTPRFETR